MKLDKDILYMKIVDLKVIYNLVIDDFLIFNQ